MHAQACYTAPMVEKIGYTRPTTATRGVRKAGSVGASGFSEALGSAEAALGASETEQASAAVPLSGVNLLGFQEVGDDEIDRRKAYKRGRLTLEALEKLRDALLFGALPMSTIHKLEEIVAQERGTTNDPMLNQILDEIELRAAVELAKLEVAMGKV